MLTTTTAAALSVCMLSIPLSDYPDRTEMQIIEFIDLVPLQITMHFIC